MKNNRGITLIALVVTIIVLMILAGVSINLILGENGIIRKSKEGSVKYGIGNEKEILALAVSDIQIKNTGKAIIENEDALKTAIKNNSGREDVKVEKVSEQIYMVTYLDSARQYKVFSDGTVKEKIVTEDEKEILTLALSDIQTENKWQTIIKNEEALKAAIKNNSSIDMENIEVEKVSNQTYMVSFANSGACYNVSANGTIREKTEPTSVYVTYNQSEEVYTLSNDKIDDTSIEIGSEYKRNWGSKVKIENKIAPTSTYQWFSGTIEIEGLENLDMSNVTDMRAMFNGCSAPNLDLSSWDTSNATDMSNMFMYCTATNINVSNWDVSNVNNMSMMFNNCWKLEELKGLSDWDVSNVTNMKDMFSYCEKVKTLGNLNDWDVSNVTDMFNMFGDCHELVTVGDLSKWNVSNVTNMTNMFADCAKLVTPGDLSKWNIGNVTSIGYMFGGCYELTTVGNLDNWNIANISNISSSGIFSGCDKVSPIPSWYAQ